MSVVQGVLIGVVALGGAAVVVARDPLRETFLLGVYGLALTALFFALQAPDVALSELVISGIAMPVIVLAALRKIRRHENEDE